MVEQDRIEDENLWIYRFDPKNYKEIRREAEDIIEEFHRQRRLRGLWFPPRLQEMPILHDQIVRTLAIDPTRVDNAAFMLEYNHRLTMATFPNDTFENKKKLQELELALSPFLTKHDLSCPLCQLGFSTKAGLLSHLRGNSCLLKRYPEYSALLHWAYHLVRTDLNIPTTSLGTFESEKIRTGTTYEASKVTRTYSKMATNLGLLNCNLVDSQKEQSKENIAKVFKKLMECLTKPAPVDATLVNDITEEYLKLQVTINACYNKWPRLDICKPMH